MANPNALADIVDVQVNILQGGGLSVQSFSDPIFVSTFPANGSFPDRTKAYTGTLTQMRAGLVADGFSTTSPAYRQITSAGLQQGPPSRIYIGRADAADLNWTDSLTSIWAGAELADQSLYFLTVDERDPISIEQIADWAQTTFVQYQAQTDSASVYNNQPGNAAANIIAKGYDRTSMLWHSPANASNYAPASLVGRTGPFSLSSTSGTVDVRINNGALQTFTLTAFAAELLGSNTETFAFSNGDTFTTTIDDGAGGEQVVTVTIVAATILSGIAETYFLLPGWTLTVRVDGEGAQTVTVVGVAGTITTAAELYAMNPADSVTFDIDGTGNQVILVDTVTDAASLFIALSALSGATVVNNGTTVSVTSNRFGESSNVEIVAGAANALTELGLVVGDNFGSSGATSIAFLDATTAAEFALLFNSDIPDATAVDETGSVRLTSDTVGRSSRIQIIGGFVNDVMSFSTTEAAGSGVFADGAAVPASDVVAWLSGALFGVTVSEVAGAVQLATLSRGSGSKITVPAGAVATVLGFAVGVTAGTGNISNASIVTASEVAAIISGTIIDGTATAVSSALILSSLVLGPTSSVVVTGGTYASVFFDTLSAAGTGTDEDYADCAWVGRCSTFPLDSPDGQSTWDNHPLVGILPDVIPSNVRTVLHNTLKVNTFENRNGRAETHFGTVLFGTSETVFRYIDQRVTADWGDARLTESFKGTLNALSDAKKAAPYTADGTALFENVFLAFIARGDTNGHWISDTTEITGFDDTGVEIPTIAGQTAADFAARKLSGFKAQLQFKNRIQRIGAQLNLLSFQTIAA